MKTMATKEAAPVQVPRGATKLKTVTFGAPAELAAEFGVQTAAEGHIQGVVATENVRALLDAFGLDARKEVTFPFQHIDKQKGERWSMRIEPVSGHTLDGVPVMGHQWMFRQEWPEHMA